MKLIPTKTPTAIPWTKRGGHDENGVTAEFRQWEAIEASEKLPESAIQPLLSVNSMIRQVTLKVVYDALGIKRNKKGKR